VTLSVPAYVFSVAPTELGDPRVAQWQRSPPLGPEKAKMKTRHPTVYVVEDSPIIRNILIELIERTGATVVGYADTASAAIADIAALRPDVVTIDISLKAGTGFDVLEALAVNSAVGNPPLRIVLTNYTTDAYRGAAQQLGADHIFDKTMQIKEVLTVLESLTRNAQGGAVAA
jgi:DNA-binding NarL/FixJ family response regulator